LGANVGIIFDVCKKKAEKPQGSGFRVQSSGFRFQVIKKTPQGLGGGIYRVLRGQRPPLYFPLRGRFGGGL
jgi:hypothetical protein